MKLNLNDLPPHIKARNPHLFTVGAVPRPAPQPDPVHVSAPAHAGKETGTPSLEQRKGPILRVLLISCRHRLSPDASDALAPGFKALRDSIAESFEIDDADRLIEWRYAQQQTREQGVIVMIESLI